MKLHKDQPDFIENKAEQNQVGAMASLLKDNVC
jgi:hypothetical protein